MSLKSDISPIRWDNDRLILLDQRYLPARHDDYVCETLEQAAQGIADLVVRGAPAIGITAAYAVYLGYQQKRQHAGYDLDAALARLEHARPTAVNLAWAVRRQRAIIDHNADDAGPALLANAQQIHQQDLADNIRIGDFGAELIAPGSRVLTHCNAGALATAGYGTALGVIRSAWSNQRLDKVFASETRPWTQGLRLTAWELAEDGIDVTLIIEGAAASLFARQSIDWVIVGADRICANGDVINKVGTANLALLAQHYGVKFMVAAPTSTIDMQTESGDRVNIENRSANEILAGQYSDNERVDAWNPVFDVTDAAWVSAIVSEKGVIEAPNRSKVSRLMQAE